MIENNNNERFSLVSNEKYKLTGIHYYNMLIYFRELCEAYADVEAKREIMKLRTEARNEGRNLRSNLSWSNYNNVIKQEIDDINIWLEKHRWIVKSKRSDMTNFVNKRKD